MDVVTELRILPLRDCSDCLDQIASWHQQEWQQQDLAERTRQLTTHLSDEAIPTTLVAFSGDCAVGSVSLVRYQRLGATLPVSGWPICMWYRSCAGRVLARD